MQAVVWKLTYAGIMRKGSSQKHPSFKEAANLNRMKSYNIIAITCAAAPVLLGACAHDTTPAPAPASHSMSSRHREYNPETGRWEFNNLAELRRFLPTRGHLKTRTCNSAPAFGASSTDPSMRNGRRRCGIRDTAMPRFQNPLNSGKTLVSRKAGERRIPYFNFKSCSSLRGNSASSPSPLSTRRNSRRAVAPAEWMWLTRTSMTGTPFLCRDRWMLCGRT